MVVCLHNGDEKDFSFTFRGSSCRGDFFRGAKKLHDLYHNFVVSNVVVDFDRVNDCFAMTVCSEACAEADILALGPQRVKEIFVNARTKNFKEFKNLYNSIKSTVVRILQKITMFRATYIQM